MTFQHTERKTTKDHVYEKKLEEHNATIAGIEAKMAKLRQRMQMISEEVRSLTAEDTNLAAREELRSQIEVLRANKDRLIAAKNPIFQRLQECQALFRRKMDDLQSAKEKLPFKRTEDVDKLLVEYEAQVTSGQLKLIEEKRIVAEMSKLRKARKQIESFNGDSTMVELKKSIDSLRSNMGEKDVELKKLQEQLNSLHDQLGQMSSIRSVSQNKIKALLNEKAALSKSMNGLFEEKNVVRDGFSTAKKAHSQWIEHNNLSHEEQFIQRNIDYEVRQLEQSIQDMATPANSTKIQDATTLQNYLRHNILKETTSNRPQPSSAAGRQVEALDESLVMKTKFNKEEETYMNFGKSKKTAAKKPVSEAAPVDVYKLPIWILSDFEALKIKDAPLSCKKDDLFRLIADLDVVKIELDKEQEKIASTVDTQKQAIEAKIAALKERNVREEAAKALKIKQDQRKANPPVSKGAPGMMVQG